jgi:hypothetical protein
VENEIQVITLMGTWLSIIPPQFFITLAVVVLFFILRKIIRYKKLTITLHILKRHRTFKVKEGLEKHLLELNRILIDGCTTLGSEPSSSTNNNAIAVAFLIQGCISTITSSIDEFPEVLELNVRDEVHRLIDFVKTRLIQETQRPRNGAGPDTEKLLTGYMEASRKIKVLVRALNEITVHSSLDVGQ